MKIPVVLLMLLAIVLIIGYRIEIGEYNAMKESKDSLQTQLAQTKKDFQSFKGAHEDCAPISDLEPLEENHVVLTKKEYNNLLSQVAKGVPMARYLAPEEREIMEKMAQQWEEEFKYSKKYDTRVYKLCPIDSILTKDSTQQK